MANQAHPTLPAPLLRTRHYTKRRYTIPRIKEGAQHRLTNIIWSMVHRENDLMVDRLPISYKTTQPAENFDKCEHISRPLTVWEQNAFCSQIILPF